MEILRNLGRRKLRTGLTVFGIAIGIFALAVMGSLSEFLNNTVNSGIKYTGDIVRVLPANTSRGLGVFKEVQADKIRTLDHVKKVTGFVAASADDNPSGGINIGIGSKSINGLNPDAVQDVFGTVPLTEGRLLQAGDSGVVDIGQTVAAQSGLKLNDTTTFRGYTVKIVGIFSPTQNGEIDSVIVAPLKDVQKLNDSEGLVSAFVAIPDQPSNAKTVADEINKTYPKEFNALDPEALKKTVAEGLLIFNIIILAGAALAAVVGGFSTINTMIMSVIERTREIGVKKAVGASSVQIMREFLFESALMGLLGGLVGIGLAKLATIGINSYTKANVGGLSIFDLTPRLALAALIFAVVLGAVAGVIPAISAARLNIVKALRTE